MRGLTDRCRPPVSSDVSTHRGFTLIELLVSMTILVIIMLIITMIFHRASTAWETGMRKVEVDMTGRSLADFISQELSMAMCDTNGHSEFSVAGNQATFWMLGDATTNGIRALRLVEYSGAAGAKRKETGEAAPVDLAERVTDITFECEPVSVPAGELPRYADITVTLTNDFSEDVIYQSRAYFVNRNRNRF